MTSYFCLYCGKQLGRESFKDNEGQEHCSKRCAARQERQNKAESDDIDIQAKAEDEALRTGNLSFFHGARRMRLEREER